MLRPKVNRFDVKEINPIFLFFLETSSMIILAQEATSQGCDINFRFRWVRVGRKIGLQRKWEKTLMALSHSHFIITELLRQVPPRDIPRQKRDLWYPLD